MSEKLFQHGINSILIEGGASTFRQFIEMAYFDRLFCFYAPILIGDGSGLSWTKDLKINTLSDKIILQKPKVLSLGNDVLLSLRR